MSIYATPTLKIILAYIGIVFPAPRAAPRPPTSTNWVSSAAVWTKRWTRRATCPDTPPRAAGPRPPITELLASDWLKHRPAEATVLFKFFDVWLVRTERFYEASKAGIFKHRFYAPGYVAFWFKLTLMHFHINWPGIYLSIRIVPNWTY